MPTVTAPETPTVLVIDYEITLAGGKEFQFSLRPDLGDEAESTLDDIRLHFARTGHEVVLDRRHIAVVSKRERQMKVVPTVESKTPPPPANGRI